MEALGGNVGRHIVGCGNGGGVHKERPIGTGGPLITLKTSHTRNAKISIGWLGADRGRCHMLI